MFGVMKYGYGANKGREYGGDYGERTLRDLITHLLVEEEAEKRDDLDWLDIRISGDLFKRLPLTDDARREAMDRLGYEDPVDIVMKVPMKDVDFVLDLPGGATAFTDTMQGARGCFFTVYTRKRVFGTASVEFRRCILSAPRHPERD